MPKLGSLFFMLFLLSTNVRAADTSAAASQSGDMMNALADQILGSNSEAFDPADSLCNSLLLGNVQTYQNGIKWITFAVDWKEYAEELKKRKCSSAAYLALTNILTTEQKNISLGQSVSLAASMVSRSPGLSPERRYANDAEMLGYMIISCKSDKTTTGLECIQSILNYIDDDFISSSPVFCDFNPDKDKISDMKDQYELINLNKIPAICTHLTESNSTSDNYIDTWWNSIFEVQNPVKKEN